MKYLIIAMLALVVFAGCTAPAEPTESVYVEETPGTQETQTVDTTDPSIVVITVGPMKRECYGMFPQMCLVVDGNNFYDGIEGFEHQEGYEYELTVRRVEVENPPQDASSFRYVLVEELSKVPTVQR